MILKTFRTFFMVSILYGIHLGRVFEPASPFIGLSHCSLENLWTLLPFLPIKLRAAALKYGQ